MFWFPEVHGETIGFVNHTSWHGVADSLKIRVVAHVGDCAFVMLFMTRDPLVKRIG